MAGIQVLLLLLLACAPAWAQVDTARRIAITIDDLPWALLEGLDEAQLGARHRQLMEALDVAAVPVTGFVNGDRFASGGRLLPGGVRMLVDGLDRGHELGNHTHGHLDLHAVGLEAYQQAILEGERELRPLLAGAGTTPRWFRHPYLRAGRSADERAALQAFLAARGYRIAPVTIDNSDWIWALACRKALESAPDPSREDTLARLRRDYVPYMLDKAAYFERQSQSLLGREIAQVWLLHANELNAAVLPRWSRACRRAATGSCRWRRRWRTRPTCVARRDTTAPTGPAGCTAGRWAKAGAATSSPASPKHRPGCWRWRAWSRNSGRPARPRAATMRRSPRRMERRCRTRPSPPPSATCSRPTASAC